MTTSAATNPYWRRALDLLRRRLTSAQVETWLLSLVPLRLSGSVARFGCPNRFHQTWLEEHYGRPIQEALNSSGLVVEEVRFEVVAAAPGAQEAQPRAVLELNREYTFETFVVGEGNRLAYEAARPVAEAPGRRYNPRLRGRRPASAHRAETP